MKRIIICIPALCCILMGCGKPPTNKPATEASSSLAVDSSIPSLDNTIAESSRLDDWNPTEENTFRYLDGTGNTNGVLERWIGAYCSGEPSQIYVDDPHVFLSWQLTCNGSDKYLIERSSAGSIDSEICGYSRIITDGAIYYTFGEDLDGIDWLPLTIYKGLYAFTTIDSDNELWIQQVEIPEAQAAELAAEVFEYKENFTYRPHAREVYSGKCFYYFRVFGGEEKTQYSGHVYVRSCSHR